MRPAARTPDLFDQGDRLSDDGLYEQAIERWNLLIERFGESSDPAVRERIVLAMYKTGHALDHLGRGEEAAEAYGLVAWRLGDAPESPLLRLIAADALIRQGHWLGSRGLGWREAGIQGVGSPEAAIERYDLVAERFGGDPDVGVRGTVAFALLAKGHMLERLGRRAEAVDAYDLVVNRCGEDPDPAFRELAERATNYKELAEARSRDGSAP